MFKKILGIGLIQLLSINSFSKTNIPFKYTYDLDNYIKTGSSKTQFYSLKYDKKNNFNEFKINFNNQEDSLLLNDFFNKKYFVYIKLYYDIYSDIVSNEFFSIKYNAKYTGSKFKLDFKKFFDENY